MKVNVTKLCKKAIIWSIVICLIQRGLYDYIGSWTFGISFLPDIFLLIGTAFTFSNGDRKLKFSKKAISSFILFLFIMYEIISLVYGGSLIIGLKILRYAADAGMIFFLCRKYVDECFITSTFKTLRILLVLDLLLTMHQFFILKLHPDFCNGIFGYTEYMNAQQGFFCLLICAGALAGYLTKKTTLKSLASYLAIPSVICALSEVKFFFVALIIICIVAVALSLNDVKKIRRFFIIILTLVGALILGYHLLSIYMPDNLYTFFNLTDYLGYEEYAQHRSGVGRFNQLEFIFNHEYNGSLLASIIGKGIGQDWSKYAYDLGKIFLQTGIIGLILIFSFLAFDFGEAFRYRKEEVGLLVILASIIAVIAIINWYCVLNNNCYFAFYFLALIPDSRRRRIKT